MRAAVVGGSVAEDALLSSNVDAGSSSAAFAQGLMRLMAPPNSELLVGCRTSDGDGPRKIDDEHSVSCIVYALTCGRAQGRRRVGGGMFGKAGCSVCKKTTYDDQKKKKIPLVLAETLHLVV